MEKKESCKRTRVLAIIMVICGLFLWFFAETDKPIIRDLISGVGIFLFIVGTANMNKLKSWTELNKKEKNTKVFLLVTTTLFLLAGIIVLMIRNY